MHHIDIVDICTPPFVHLARVLAALAASTQSEEEPGIVTAKPPRFQGLGFKGLQNRRNPCS